MEDGRSILHPPSSILHPPSSVQVRRSRRGDPPPWLGGDALPGRQQVQTKQEESKPNKRYFSSQDKFLLGWSSFSPVVFSNMSINVVLSYPPLARYTGDWIGGLREGCGVQVQLIHWWPSKSERGSFVSYWVAKTDRHFLQPQTQNCIKLYKVFRIHYRVAATQRPNITCHR